MEASLLPSRELAALGKKVVLAAAKRTDPVCERLREEFDIPFQNSWVLVLDAKGETLASWIGDTVGAGCREESVGKFPRNFAKLIKTSLKGKVSREELIRQWEQNRNDLKAWKTLKSCLNNQLAHRRLGELCDRGLADVRLTQEIRDALTMESFLTRARGVRGLDGDEARAQWLEEGERLLVRFAGHPNAAELAQALFSYGVAHSFDVPAKSDQLLARLENQAKERSDPKALQIHIRELRELRAKWIELNEKFLRESPDEHTRNFIAAFLGDAEAAIQMFSQPPYTQIPQYQQWLRDAREKLAQEPTHS